MTNPLVSVCVPTYNGSRFLRDTLQSISRQTFTDFELLIVDDGSEDDTLALAQACAASDPRTRVLRNDVRAGSGARNANRCIAHARGEWIKFLFQDDLMAPTCLERMLEAGRHGRFVICWHDYVFEPEIAPNVRQQYETLPSLETTLPGRHASPDAFCDAVLRLWHINFIGPTSTSLIHRDCFRQYGSFNSEITMFPDLEYWMRVGSHEGLAIVPERLVSFRVHGDSISAALRAEDANESKHTLQLLLLLLHLARAPEYARLRARTIGQQPPVDPDALLIHAALQARWHAIEKRYRTRDDSMLQSWKAFCDEHPELLDTLRAADAKTPLWSRLKRFVKERV